MPQSRPTPLSRATGPLTLWLCLLCLSACVRIGHHPPTASAPPLTGPLSSQPLISLCLTAGGEAQGQEAWVTLEAVELSDGEQWRSLLPQPLTITSGQAVAGALLERSALPSGHYPRLRLRLGQAGVRREGRELPLQRPQGPIEMPLTPALTLKEGDSSALFLRWDIAGSLAFTPAFTPAIAASGQRPPLTTELAVVSCPEINTVYLIRSDQNRICAAWGVPGRPGALHIDQATKTVYVLTHDPASIVLIELPSGQTRDRISIPLGARPSLMTIDQGGDNAYLVDQTTGVVYRLDLASGSLAAQSRLGGQLSAATFLDGSGLLAVSAAQSQQVVLLDPASLQVRQALRVGAGPQGLAEYGGGLLVAEGRANTVGFYPLQAGPSSRQAVGRGPSQVLLHEHRLFVANSEGGSITVLRPEQLTVIDEISTGGTPGQMAVAPTRNWLYAADSNGNEVTVIDLASQRRLTTIDLKTRPGDIAVLR